MNVENIGWRRIFALFGRNVSGPGDGYDATDQVRPTAGHGIGHETAIGVTYDIDPLGIDGKAALRLLKQATQISDIVDSAFFLIAAFSRSVPEAPALGILLTIGHEQEELLAIVHTCQTQPKVRLLGRTAYAVQHDDKRIGLGFAVWGRCMQSGRSYAAEVKSFGLGCGCHVQAGKTKHDVAQHGFPSFFDWSRLKFNCVQSASANPNRLRH